MNSACLKLCLVLIFACLPISAERSHPPLPPPQIARALGCLFPIDDFTTKFLRLGKHEGLRYRYLEGPIPNTGDATLKHNFVNITLYDDRQTRAILYTVILNGTTIEVDQWHFLFTRSRGKWEAERGPSGPGTWVAVQEYMNGSQEVPINSIRPGDLRTQTQGCVAGRILTAE
jgi:hypothetical protein